MQPQLFFHSVLQLQRAEGKERFNNSKRAFIPALPSAIICRRRVNPPDQLQKEVLLGAATLKLRRLCRSAAEYQTPK